MHSTLTLVPSTPVNWVSTDELVRPGDILDRCTVAVVQDAVAHLEGVRVVSVTVNTSGEYGETLDDAQPENFDAITSNRVEQAALETNLPDFCDVRLEQSVGGHVVKTTVWVPLAWNGRFFGLGGQGNRASAPWIYPDVVRIASLPRVLRNGFAGAETDAGNRDPRFADWGLDVETHELDWELIRNWAHRSTHDMTLIGKAVTTALHGKSPIYSYFQGTSGGGRQGMMEVQRYPQDYDGVWVSDGGINWTRVIPGTMWPAVVMKDYGNPLPPAKLRAFREAIVERCSTDSQRDGFISDLEVPFWDAEELVGTSTETGPITATDAVVMQKIWEGPRTADGEFLWYGIRPGSESWGDNIYGAGLALTAEVDGALAPVPFEIGRAYACWIARDPDWDWTTLTMENFHEFMETSVREFAEIDTSDPDLTGLRDSGGKLLLTHALDDEVIAAAGTLHYYLRVLERMGGIESTSPFARLFMSPGEGHSHVTAAGPGLTLSNGMIALMNWVEKGMAPDSIRTERYDLATGERTMSRLVCAYPRVSNYVGS
ncbi:Chlorogenate esterase [Rhodococcus wratislaviensis]|uniref:Chlorogenate esterase n=1 Tax=Rhodococcus wratislaviensis TaxID=44752 RepID=A0A402CDA1_RHOWR|nr:tannase/feruloyl esterase family alpha/beta hydrolase [Rhodococcus wratislaviensis]GCE41586.1 Chlorogenate esterase [Rhodococcus wratislaviensis]